MTQNEREVTGDKVSEDQLPEEQAPENPEADHLGNLAFMKALVSEGPRMQASTGLMFMVGGTAYGLQCLLQWVEYAKLAKYPPLLSLTVAILPTIVVMVAIFYLIWRDRKVKQQGVATRALNAIFSSTGLANLFMMTVFGYNAITHKSLIVWLFYPIVVCAFQGAAWYAAYMIRKKAWLALISAGWFLTTLALGYYIQTDTYVLVLGIALLALMGGGGYVMMQQARVVTINSEKAMT